jgi:chromosome segregation ATPase
MALAEYLLFTYDKDPVKFATAPQGSASAEEQAMLDAAEEQLRKLSDLFDQLAAAKKAAEDAEAEVRAIKKEAEEIQAEIKAQEDAKAANIARLEALSTDQSVGIVKRNMAVQELAAAKNEDPLPLRKAKLTQDAVVRRLEKAVAAAAAATQAATDKATECAGKLKEAQEAFEDLKARCSGIAHGSIWFMDRTLKEKAKYLPGYKP